MQTIKKIIFITLVLSVFIPSSVHASMLTLLTSDNELSPGNPNQGYFANDINNPFPINHTFDNTYTITWVGNTKHRNYFSFYIPNIDGDITAATLQLQRGGADVEGAGVSYHLGGVTTDALTLSQNKGTRNLAMYDALGAGDTYGDFPISDPTIPGDIYGDYEDILDFELNAAAIAAINANKGGYFTLGGSLKSSVFDENKPLIGDISVFLSNPGFDILDHPQKLVLTVSPVPEPASLSLLSLGLGGLLVRRKRIG